MLKTTIYAVALGTFALTSGASAVSLQIQPPAPKSSSISSDRLLAQYSFPRQYNRLPARYPGQSYPQRPYNPSGGQNNPSSPSGGQNNPSSPSGGQNNPSSPSGGQNNPSSPSGGQNNGNSASIEQAVFDQVNQYRQSQGLPALTRNASIDEQARTHSQNMASGKVPFSHQGFDQRVKALNMPNKSASENVAYNQDKDPATRAVQSWLKSSGHLANIKGNANLTGVGVAVNGQGVVYFTQIFIRS
ncbi:CAP domain-containing protein [Trichormus variabilis ARAD]|uniref:CAP domain-containing protein n=1 Tax=Trichormus variabilis N2B TaxID=2681315 RepID=A0ABR6S6L9_ANAVA|nr:CAP domain-containing protein [Trichormus variabilis]MBC1213894.1 CAP domain-containing protein [Trichormus variabilis ARAD]MBC1256758.1 CAP domain-containing protein [Trichormus variabilis V5]MBC1266007.1 CAP domain-containing protein [Trichormus variabilis FSR]MBC1302044.1 CAP domain-containing protein [Trichormus variabilis N2B]MBC1310864.1 CAP domain-containing protein [Trichormus variabilis PNB]